MNYLCGGKLGDFIWTLNIVYKKYKESGKKGNLYFIDNGWNNNLIDTIDELSSILDELEFINSYKLFNKNISIDIDLTLWRKYQQLIWEMPLYKIFDKIYNLDGCMTEQYFFLEKKYNNYALIHSSLQRKNGNFDYNKLIDKLIEKNLIVFFITCDKKEYDDFSEKININLLYCDNLHKMLCFINGSHCFIGNFSSPMTFSLACGIKSLYLHPSENDKENIKFDNNLYKDLWKVNKNAHYYFDEKNNNYNDFLEKI